MQESQLGKEDMKAKALAERKGYAIQSTESSGAWVWGKREGRAGFDTIFSLAW